MGKISQKWVLLVLAKHGLKKNLDKSNWSLILRDQIVEGEGKKKKKRREEEREIKKVWIL